MSSKKDRNLFILVFSCIGTPFLIGGIIVSLLVPSAIEKTEKEIEELSLVTAKQIQNNIPLNQKVIIEGFISKDNSQKDIPLVAYQEYNLRADSKGKKTWKKGILVNPKLIIFVQDGLVEIESGYKINKSVRSVKVGTRKDKSYSGFAILDPIMIAGIVTNNEKEIPQIKAEIVAAGTKSEYLADFPKGITIFRIMGISFIIFGVIFDALALVIWKRQRIA